MGDDGDVHETADNKDKMTEEEAKLSADFAAMEAKRQYDEKHTQVTFQPGDRGCPEATYTTDTTFQEILRESGLNSAQVFLR